MGDVKEECGVFGVYLKNTKDKTLVPRLIYSGLSQLQHRGQLSAGFAVLDPNCGIYRKRLSVLKKTGLVDELFEANHNSKSEKLFHDYRGIAGIGHVRYCTSGGADNEQFIINGTQPFERRHGRLWKRFAFGYNGNLTNYTDLKKRLKTQEGYHLDTTTDTEVIMHLISINLKIIADNSGKNIKPSHFDVHRKLMEQLDGAYNLIELFADGDMVTIRDPLGFKPLVWGESQDFYAIASESVALEKIGINKFFPVSPGSCMVFNKQGVKSEQLIKSSILSRCHFECDYFSKEGSFFDNQSIHLTRRKLGENLVDIDPLKSEVIKNPKDYVVIPVPKTAIPAAEAFAEKLGVRYSSAILKSGSKRGFINPKNTRKKIMDNVYSVLSEEVRGKKIFVFEDSAVRGETIQRVIGPLRNAGAVEIHFRSTEPPIRYPCFYGIDFPTKGELIASQYNPEDFEKKFAEKIGADSAVFQTLEGLVNATGFDRGGLCLACLTGEYPTPGGRRLARLVR
ncbi:MAG: amidophosphoribosyltransferase [Candidatus Pacearchaeota archaeon]